MWKVLRSEVAKACCHISCFEGQAGVKVAYGGLEPIVSDTIERGRKALSERQP